ncbi:phosphocarrier protein HPr [Robertmurraya siralis]|uniref:Phosphocarrier protein HPr n=1 Tax=Robertmurraya siralis TaxID=77777 RepID=A0A920BUU3_9BACI|nr:HPr family phosphocarrier protein [Robertmurraya siralis]PAE21269.1 phosphocarrier protein HPr [Bacillus sp. 7504-2]GIN63635.1 phosphocarrier protein HPr [Robertmurraya siralis]
MLERQYKIIDRAGLHARPATKLVQTANKFKCTITLEYKGRETNLRSIVGLMTLGVVTGEHIKIKTAGTDEVEAIEFIESTLKKEGICE